ncbi:TonB-dependent receptor [Exilibacterium tricleocarpae]|uniref:TonB-dependent receptor n=2 Tax=Exilibacterium tricleocarpae TaxID=2591008 RepID=A0A545TVY9_9GAMM|nr:TonB-dependent receptor [Exilibacterium tricleocarpae]
MAVSAFDASTIDNLDINSIDDVARFAPGLSFSKAFGRATERPVIRGLGNVLAGVQFGVESGAAYFVDGVYYPGDIQGLDLGDVERVEVIKGPQSALYGRNTYSGAINFVTRSPAAEFSGNGIVKIVEDGEQDIRLTFSGPLIEGVLGAGLSLRRYEFDGQWDNTVTGEAVGDESTQSISGVLDWSPNENLRIRWRTQYQEDDDGTRPLFLQSAARNNCFPGLRSLASFPFSGSSNNFQYFCGALQPAPIALNDGDDADGVPNLVAGVPATGSTFFGNAYALTDGTAFDGVERELLLTSLLADIELPGGYSLTGALAWRDEELKTGSDSDHSSLSFKFTPPAIDALEESFFALSSGADTEDYSVELRLQSPAEENLRWMLGAFYYDEERDGFDITFTDGSGLPDSEEQLENQAAFASVEYDVSEALTVTAEARYAQETKALTDLDTDSGAIDFEDSDTWYSFTPRLTLNYRLNENVILYGIYSEGAKPGGFNGADGASVGQPTYEQEESTNYEAGIKSILWGGRVKANASLFFIEVSDVQLTTPLADPGGALNSIATNQGEGEVSGIEIELRAALARNLEAGVTYALADTEFTDGCDEFQWTLTSGGGRFTGDEATSLDLTGNGSCSIEGKQFPLASKHQASAFIDYRRPVFGGGIAFFAGVDVSYESKKFAQVHNLIYAPAATLVGARIGLEADNWKLMLFGRNLTDEDAVPMVTRWLQVPYFAFSSLNTATQVTGADTGAPRAYFGALRRQRQYGLELSYSF